jgi:hypothetical protein
VRALIRAGFGDRFGFYFGKTNKYWELRGGTWVCCMVEKLGPARGS